MGKDDRGSYGRTMAIKRMDHPGAVVEDLEAAVAFFVELGMEVDGRGRLEGDWVGRVIGLEDVRADIVTVQTPDGRGKIELTRFDSPPPVDPEPRAPNALGWRNVMFLVDDIHDTVARLQAHGGELIGGIEQYEDVFLLCDLRGPGGTIVSLAEELS